MPLETEGLEQVAVLWEALTGAGNTDRYGVQKVKAAVQVPVRWEWRRREVRTDDGRVVEVVAWVKSDRELENGSVLWLGKLKDVPSPPSDLYRVRVKDVIPDVKGQDTEYEYGLERWSDSLPTIGS